MTLLYTRDSIRWRLYSCDKSSYIRSVYNECHVVLLKCTEQNVNNKTLPKISQLYVHVFFCLKVIKSWLYLPFCGHGHAICMGDIVIDLKTLPVHDTRNIWQLYGNQMDLMFSEKPLRESAVMFFYWGLHIFFDLSWVCVDADHQADIQSALMADTYMA